MNNPLLSILIVSYNVSSFIDDCPDSILQDKGLRDIPYEIIIIDNASRDDSLSKIKKRKNIKLIVNSKNSGFATANNQGLKIAKGNYILLLNPDTLILHSSISQALNWLSSHPEASFCTAQLLNSDKTIQASGGFFPNLANIFTWSLGLDDLPFINKLIKPLHPHTPTFYTGDKFYLSDHQQDWITGAFLLIRTSIIKKTGPMDPDYFMYGEELEWCYRIKQKNPKTQAWYLIGPQIIHLGGASSSSAFAIQNEYLGILAFFKKHKNPIQYQIVKITLIINAGLRSLFYLASGNKQFFKIYQQTCFKL